MQTSSSAVQRLLISPEMPFVTPHLQFGITFRNGDITDITVISDITVSIATFKSRLKTALYNRAFLR